MGVICRMADDRQEASVDVSAVLPGGQGGFISCPELMTAEELIQYLRIPQISKSKDYQNVIDNLVRMHDLPCIHLCRQPLYPIEGIRQWIRDKMHKEMGR